MIYKFLIGIPIFGNVLRIFNSYAYQGDDNSDDEFAPLRLWIKAFWVPVIISFLLTCLSSANLHILINTYLQCAINLPDVASNVSPTELIISILPNLLGFGIGVYALIFALSNALVIGIQDLLKKAIIEGKRKSGSVLMLNAELAYPLIVLVLAIGVGVIGKLFSTSAIVNDIAWFVFWFSLITVIELVIALFSLGENEILIKLTPKDEDSNTQELK